MPAHPVHNAEIAEAFRKLADLLEIAGENPFRVNAYRVAAGTLESLPRDVAGMIAAGEDLTALPGIGADLAGKIGEMVRTGTLSALEEIETRVPPSLRDLLRVPGLGPRRVRAIHEALGVDSLEGLRAAARDGRLRQVPGFGPKTVAAILSELDRLARIERRMPIAEAEPIAAALEHWLRAAPGIGQVVIAGSFRRRRETVGDLDIVASVRSGPASAAALIDHFTRHADVRDVVLKGSTRSTVRLRMDFNVDLRVVAPESFGAALMYFTGARGHTIALRRRAMERGWKLNEYGLFAGERRIAGRSEAEVYAKLGLPCIIPRLRENRGEIAAAERGALPEVVRLSDIRGDLHCHSRASDGAATIREMAEAARALGHEYLAISDHSRGLGVAGGLDADRLAAQIDEIDALNEELKGIRILKSCEVEIDAEGRLDLGRDILSRLDFTICAIHRGLSDSREALTRRVLRAMDDPHFNILAHPSGRLINRRPPSALDLEAVMKAARERGCFLELNAQPARLDLDDVHCRMAREMGLMVPISTDAHAPEQLKLMRYGIDQAARGWLEAGDVLNALPLKDLLARLRR